VQRRLAREGQVLPESDRRVQRSGPLDLLSASLAVMLALALLTPPTAVISQIYGGGGNVGATHTHDFIELFNPTNTPISLAGWSIQYASATGVGDFGFSAAQLTPLGGIIQPGQYLLIREDQGAGGLELPRATPHG
jgi:hypothetical protein